MRTRFIFDLDHTAINASHRGAFDIRGNGCLDTWIANSTPENIAQDTLLPLGREWAKLLRKGAEIVVCTSRVMSEADYAMLRGHGLGWHCMLSRPPRSEEPTAQMKKRLLSTLPGGWSEVCRTSIAFDDDASVLEYLSAHGLRVHDAVRVNYWLEN